MTSRRELLAAAGMLAAPRLRAAPDEREVRTAMVGIGHRGTSLDASFNELHILAVTQAMGATGQIREIARGWVATRAIVDAVAAFLYLLALFHLPLANATAINMTSPLMITVLAAVFLGERLGSSRWVAVGIGFLGVLLIIQPQAEGFITRIAVKSGDRVAPGEPGAP